MANGWGGSRPGAGRKSSAGVATSVARHTATTRAPRADSGQLVPRNDGWANVFTGKGIVGKDPRASSRFAGTAILTEPELDEMYRHGGVMGRVVDELPNLITMHPWTLAGDSGSEVWRYLEARGAPAAIRRAMKWARLKGGAIIVMGVNDGGSLESELKPDKGSKGLDFLRVYDRFRVQSLTEDYETNARQPRYGKRNFYTVQPLNFMGGSRTFRAHWSRVIEIDGRDVTDQVRVQNTGWGDSILQRVHEEVRRYVDAMDDGELVLRDFVQSVLQIKNLSGLLSTPDGEKLVQQRLNILDLSRHMLNMMLVDEGETYSKQISSMSGVPDLLDRFAGAVASAAEMPQAVLFGRSPAGLNATGESDMQTWYDSSAAYQRETMSPIVLCLAKIALAAKDGPKVTFANPELSVMFQPLKQMTLKEQAELREKMAEADERYITNNVLTPEEVALARFGGDQYSIETKLIEDRSKPLPTPEADPADDVPPPPKPKA